MSGKSVKQDPKRCSACGEMKPRSSFHLNGRGVSGRCKECSNALRRARYRADPQRQIAAARRWKQAHPERVRAWQRTYSAKNRERLREYHRVWRQRRKQSAAAGELVKKLV